MQVGSPINSESASSLSPPAHRGGATFLTLTQLLRVPRSEETRRAQARAFESRRQAVHARVTNEYVRFGVKNE